MTKRRPVCIYHYNEVPRCVRQERPLPDNFGRIGKNRPSTAPISIIPASSMRTPRTFNGVLLIGPSTLKLLITRCQIINLIFVASCSTLHLDLRCIPILIASWPLLHLDPRGILILVQKEFPLVDSTPPSENELSTLTITRNPDNFVDTRRASANKRPNLHHSFYWFLAIRCWTISHGNQHILSINYPLPNHSLNAEWTWWKHKTGCSKYANMFNSSSLVVVWPMVWYGNQYLDFRHEAWGLWRVFSQAQKCEAAQITALFLWLFFSDSTIEGGQ